MLYLRHVATMLVFVPPGGWFNHLPAPVLLPPFVLSTLFPPHPHPGPYAIIIWLHGGDGTITGGRFRVPLLGVELMPLEFTVVVMSTAIMPHGTGQLEWTGSVVRLGSSHFLRVPDLENLCWLHKGLVAKETTAQKMELCLREEIALAAQEDKGEIEAEYAELRRTAIDIGRQEGEVVHRACLHKGLVLWSTRKERAAARK